MKPVLLWIYTRLLRLYPAEFYERFAAEMAETYRLLLDEQSTRASLREILALLVAIAQEHQRPVYRLNPIPFWLMLAVLMLPVLAGCVVLLFRSVTVFYLSDKVWLLFAGLSLAIVGLGWLQGRGLSLLALPVLGFMLFIGLRIFSTPPFPGYFIPIIVQTAAPYFGLLVVLALWSRRNWLRWLMPLVALPLTGLVFSVVVMWENGTLNRVTPIVSLLRDYTLGALLPSGELALLVLIGLPLARRFDSKAVLLIVGYLFFHLLGLSATLPNLDLQRVTGAAYVVLFLLLIPLLVLQLPRRWERTGILLPIALAYGALFLVKEIAGDSSATFTLYRTNELAQTLIALHLALTVYGEYRPKSKAAQPRSSHWTSALPEN